MTAEASNEERARRWMVRLAVALALTFAILLVLRFRQAVPSEQAAQILGGSLSFVTLTDVFWFSRRKRP